MKTNILIVPLGWQLTIDDNHDIKNVNIDIVLITDM